jgi:hypothetical protein
VVGRQCFLDQSRQQRIVETTPELVVGGENETTVLHGGFAINATTLPGLVGLREVFWRGHVGAHKIRPDRARRQHHRGDGDGKRTKVESAHHGNVSSK